jgi:hypothetical protein
MIVPLAIEQETWTRCRVTARTGPRARWRCPSTSTTSRTCLRQEAIVVAITRSFTRSTTSRGDRTDFFYGSSAARLPELLTPPDGNRVEIDRRRARRNPRTWWRERVFRPRPIRFDATGTRNGIFSTARHNALQNYVRPTSLEHDVTVS